MHYSFDLEIAQQFGVDEAIIIQNFIYWIGKNKANRKNIHNGRTWTFNSVSALAEIFPFWKESQIRRILKSLIDKKVLITGNFNKSPYDRTLWYAFANEALFIKTSTTADMSIESIDEYQPDEEEDAADYSVKNEIAESRQQEFDEFWEAYTPVKSSDGHFVSKGNKKNCKIKFEKLRKEGVKNETIVGGVKSYIKYCQQNGYCTCGAEVFLNQRRFENDYSGVAVIESDRKNTAKNSYGGASLLDIGREFIEESKNMYGNDIY